MLTEIKTGIKTGKQKAPNNVKMIVITILELNSFENSELAIIILNASVKVACDCGSLSYTIPKAATQYKKYTVSNNEETVKTDVIITIR